MKTRERHRRALGLMAMGVLGLGLSVGCGARGPSAVREVAAPKLQCPRSELHVQLNRTTSKVREYVAACDFMYTRVLCDGAGCRPAPVKPPCIEGLPCFTEDPETLEWTLNDISERTGRL